MSANGMPGKARWGFVAAGFLANLCMGANFSWSVFRKPLETLLDVGATQSGLPFTFFLGSFVLAALAASRFLERLGPRRTMILGAAVAGAGWCLASLSTNMLMLALCYGVLGGCGTGWAYGVPIAVASRWFPENRGLAVGLTLAGYGLSPIFTAPLAAALIGAWGPMAAFRFLGLGNMVAISILACFMRFPQHDAATPPVGSASAPDAANIRLHPWGLFRGATFTGLYLCYFLAALSGPMAIGISSPVAQEIIGLSAAQATAFVVVFALFNATGRTLFGYLADRLTPRYAAALSFTIVLAASLGMLRAGPGDVALYAVCFEAFWLTIGGWMAIAPAATMTFFGSHYQVRNYGIVFTAYGVGGVLGIVLSGMMRDAFGTYRAAFIPTAALAAVGAVVSLCMLKPRNVG